MATPPAAPSSFPSASEPLRGSRTHCPRLCRGLLAGGRPAGRLDQQVGPSGACQSGISDPITPAKADGLLDLGQPTSMLRTIASVLSRGLGRREICICSTLPVLSTIGGDGDIAFQQQADFLLVVGPGERTDLTASGGPTGQAQALQLRWIRIGGDREAAGHSCLKRTKGHCIFRSQPCEEPLPEDASGTQLQGSTGPRAGLKRKVVTSMRWVCRRSPPCRRRRNRASAGRRDTRWHSAAHRHHLHTDRRQCDQRQLDVLNAEGNADDRDKAGQR